MSTYSDVLNVVFSDENNNDHSLHYLLYNNDLVKRWKSMVETNIKDNETYINTTMYNYNYKNTPKLRTQLNEVINKINSYGYPDKLPLFDNVEVFDTDVLNYLHEQYENYGETIDYHVTKPYWNKDLHDNFLRLNELIHCHEDANRNNKNTFPAFSALVDYYPQKYFLPIEERDKLYLKSDFKWGNLYLGYNTLGKCWMKVGIDRDTEVIERDQVKPQHRFAAEMWLNFGPDDDDGFNALRFEKWYDTLSDELKSKIPFNNLNEMTFGRFIIGKLDLSRPYFLNYHSNISDWQSRSNYIKQKWNNEVFSTFTGIKHIGFN